MFEELKKSMSTELKESTKTMSYQIKKKINIEIEIKENNQIEIQRLKWKFTGEAQQQISVHRKKSMNLKTELLRLYSQRSIKKKE